MAEQSAPATSSAGDKEILIARLRQGRDRYLLRFPRSARKQFIVAQDSRHLVHHWSARSTSRWPRSRCFGHGRSWLRPARPDRANDAADLAAAHDRTRKNTAPEQSSEPKGRCESLFEALERFRVARERTLQFAESVSVEELRAKVVPHPHGRQCWTATSC